MTTSEARSTALHVAVREMSADLDTPVTAYLKATQPEPGQPERGQQVPGQQGGQPDETGAVSFLLESVEAGERLGRYSFIGVGEQGRFELRAGVAHLSGVLSASVEVEHLPTADPLGLLYSRVLRPVTLPAGLPTFVGGAVGYAAYDLIRSYERLPDANPDELDVPDALFIVPEGLVVFDHLTHRLLAVAVSADQERAEAVAERLHARLRGPLPPVPGSAPAPAPQFSSNFAPGGYAAAVEKCLEYIRAGDVFQVVPSQRFSAELTVHPFALYRALRGVNPSPYLGYLNLGEVTLVASSPESLLRSDGVSVTTRPIAGTRRRGDTPEKDAANAAELLGDEKERAEHLMLIDLGRNDIGRVASFGSVRVQDAFTIERYSHVMHIVSSVTGTLESGKTPLDALAAALPMGTVSGAPKIRAMEIIDEVEPVRRGPYGGAFGYIAYDGSLDMALTLRTMVIAGGRVHIQAGAGIVADSVPEDEERETRSKAAALMRAAEIAARGL